jgi:T5orf172 domain
MIYFIQAEGIGHIKIGFTDGEDALVRLANLQTGSPVLLRLLGVMPGGLEAEKYVQEHFADQHVHGEWFRADDALLRFVQEHAGPVRPDLCATAPPVRKPTRRRWRSGQGSPGRPDRALQKAQAFLRELLTRQPVLARDGLRQAAHAGISFRTLQRARAAMGVVSEHLGTSWVWRTPFIGV